MLRTGARIAAAGTAIGAAGGGVLGWRYVTDKPFRTHVREAYPYIAARVDETMRTHAPRRFVVMRVQDETDAEDPSAPSNWPNLELPSVVPAETPAPATSVTPAAAEPSARSASSSVMPSLPGSILSAADSWAPESGSALPPVVDDDPEVDGAPAPELTSAHRLIDVEPALADDVAVEAATGAHATVAGGDFLGQLQWLRAKEARARERLRETLESLDDHRRQLRAGGGLQPGGGRLLELEQSARMLRTQLDDLAAAKLSVKVRGTFQ